MERKHYYTDEKNAQIVIALLKAHGIKRVITSPGTTHMAFLGSIQYDPWFHIWSAVDERHAAFMAVGMAATIEHALKETKFVLVMVPSKPAKVATELLPVFVKYPTRVLAIFKDASFIWKADASKHNINYMLQKRDSVNRVALHFAGMFITARSKV